MHSANPLISKVVTREVGKQLDAQIPVAIAQAEAKARLLMVAAYEKAADDFVAKSGKDTERHLAALQERQDAEILAKYAEAKNEVVQTQTVTTTWNTPIIGGALSPALAVGSTDWATQVLSAAKTAPLDFSKSIDVGQLSTTLSIPNSSLPTSCFGGYWKVNQNGVFEPDKTACPGGVPTSITSPAMTLAGLKQ
jgi:hypothetical protein